MLYPGKNKIFHYDMKKTLSYLRVFQTVKKVSESWLFLIYWYQR